MVKIKAQRTEGGVTTHHLEMSAHLGAETHECETAGREEGCRKCDNSMCHCVVVTPQLSV